MIENTLKPSTNLFKIPEETMKKPINSQNSSTRMLRKRSWTIGSPNYPKFLQPIQMKTVTKRLTTFAQNNGMLSKTVTKVNLLSKNKSEMRIKIVK